MLLVDKAKYKLDRAAREMEAAATLAKFVSVAELRHTEKKHTHTKETTDRPSRSCSSSLQIATLPLRQGCKAAVGLALT
jgi:transketolase